MRDRTFAKTSNLSISSGLIHWQTTLPFSLVASNRIGIEEGDSCSLTFYGSSFIAGPLGELRQQAGSREEAVLVETFDLDEIQTMRQGWGLFRDDARPLRFAAFLGRFRLTSVGKGLSSMLHCGYGVFYENPWAESPIKRQCRKSR